MDTLNSMSAAVNLTPVVIGVISALALALVALGIVMFVYCKSQNSLEEIRKNRRKRRGVSPADARFKLQPSNGFYTSAARMPTYPQQQQPLYPMRPNPDIPRHMYLPTTAPLRQIDIDQDDPQRSNFVDIDRGPQRQTPYYLPVVRTDRFNALRPAPGPPMRTYGRDGDETADVVIPMRGLARAYVPRLVPQRRSPFQNAERVYSAAPVHHNVNTDQLPPFRQAAPAMFTPIRQPQFIGGRRIYGDQQVAFSTDGRLQFPL